MATKKKAEGDFRNIVQRKPRNDGPDLAELQEADFRKLCDAREEAAKKAKTEKKDSDDDGNKSGAKQV